MGRGKRLTGEMEGHTEILTHEEVLQILSEMARKGSVSAASVLERVLRARAEETNVDDELDRILRRDY
jgi:hypothetical protein